jgi:hypothetical protein
MGPKELARIERLNALFAGVLILGAAAFFETPVLVGVAVGAVLAVANFYGVRRLVTASLRQGGARRAALQLLLIAKMGILFVLVFLAIRFLPLSPVALAVGMSVFLISIAVESIRFAMAPHADGNSEAHDGRA